MRKVAAENAKLFTENNIASRRDLRRQPDAAQHKYKDPRGFAEFARMLAEHSAQGHALTMSMLQAKRPTLWDMEADLRRFSVPLLVIVGDEDESCLEGSLFLKRTVPTAGLLVVPRSGHNITSEEPAASTRRWPIFSPPPRPAAGSRTGRRPDPLASPVITAETLPARSVAIESASAAAKGRRSLHRPLPTRDARLNR